MDKWLFVGIFGAILTAGIIAWGLDAQRKKPGRRWLIVAVGLLAGLVAGLAMLGAIWAEARWPHRRRLIDAATIVVVCGLALAVAYDAYGPPFGIGPMVEPGRIERPLAGYSLTLPDPWRVEDVSAARELFGEEVPSDIAYDLVAVDSEAGAVAMVMVIEDEHEASLLAFMAGLRYSLDADPDYGDATSEAVSLPSGVSFRIDAVGADGRNVSLYPLSTDGPGYHVLCFSAESPPDDRWLSIAETFEFLPAAPTTATGSSVPHAPLATDPGSPIVAGGRIQRPDEGFAITFPSGWEVEHSDEWHSVEGSHRGAGLKALVTGRREAPAVESCRVSDLTRVSASWPRWTSLDDAADWATEWASAPFASVDQPVYVDLPAGRVAAIDVHYAYGLEVRDTIFVHGVRWFLLQCGAEKPPGDRWLSIAETFEFLPAE